MLRPLGDVFRNDYRVSEHLGKGCSRIVREGLNKVSAPDRSLVGTAVPTREALSVVRHVVCALLAQTLAKYSYFVQNCDLMSLR